MPVSSDKLEINSFKLNSSAEVPQVVREITQLHKNKMLIHIVSYMHNTVLVQTLRKELQRQLPDAHIVLLKHDDKEKTSVVVFDIDVEEAESLSDEVLKELYVDITNKNESLKEYRIQLFRRYFTDHLTNLPNLYQLRKDMQNDEDYGLILLKIDNFQTINNFYGFVVGDYVLEYVGNYLKKILQNHTVYRLSGAEYAITTEERMGFYELKAYLEELYQKIKI